MRHFPIILVFLSVITLTCYGAEDGKQVPRELAVMLNEMNLKIDKLQMTNMEKFQDLEIENQELKNSFKALQSENQDLCTRIKNLEKNQDFYKNTGSEFLQQNQDILSNEDKINQTQKEIQNGNVTYTEQSMDLDKRILLSDPQYTHSMELKLQELSAKVNNIETKHTSDINSLQQTFQSQITDVRAHSRPGNIYTRWGRTTCPSINGTELVYSGYAGGSLFTHNGAAANYLCMPEDPEFLDQQTNHGQTYDHDAPCVVCKSERTVIMMIPARKHCDSGWTLEYVGILVSGDAGNTAATEYVCLDSSPETELHDEVSKNGALFYYVGSRCGSLPCLPYKEQGTLPCVVCSK